MNATQRILESLEKNPRATFASLTYTSKGTGEQSNYTLLFNVNLEKLYERSRKRLLGLMLDMEKESVEFQAAQELLISLDKSLEAGIGQNPEYTQRDLWDIVDAKGNLKINKENGTFQLRGVVVTKRVIKEGVYKQVKSSPKTIAKNKLRQQLRVGRIRNFSLDMNSIKSCALNGDKLEIVN